MVGNDDDHCSEMSMFVGRSWLTFILGPEEVKTDRSNTSHDCESVVIWGLEKLGTSAPGNRHKIWTPSLVFVSGYASPLVASLTGLANMYCD